MGFAICPVPAPSYPAIQRRASSLSVSSKIANLRRGERLAKVGHPFLPFLLAYHCDPFDTSVTLNLVDCSAFLAFAELNLPLGSDRTIFAKQRPSDAQYRS